MRIAFCTDTFLPEVNGVTTVLATMRAGLVERGHEVLVISPDYPGTVAEPGVVRRRSVPCPGYSAVRLSAPIGGDVRRALAAFRPDVVHVVTEGPIGLIGRGWARRRSVPLVSSFHTDFPRYAARYLGRWAVTPTRRYLCWFHRAARFTQTPSDATREALQAVGVERAVTWGRGVDTTCFSPRRRDEGRRSERGCDADQPLVLHVSRLAVEKDVDTLVAAFRLAHARLGGAVRFAVAGDGPRSAWVRAELPFAVHSGFLTRAALADLYADADIFVFPSPTETCGLVVLEAMASGLPVIAARAGGVVEQIREGINGHLVEAGDDAGFADRIGHLVSDRPHRIGLAAGALASAADRSWDRELDRLEPMYADAVATAGVPRPSERPVLARSGLVR
jgi:glycosyltransferase involved in cell wall biosynthesis